MSSTVQRLSDRLPPTEAETQKRSCKVGHSAHCTSCVGRLWCSLLIRCISVVLHRRQIEQKERQAKLQERAEVRFSPKLLLRQEWFANTSKLQYQKFLLQRKQALRTKLNLDQFESDSDTPDPRLQDQSGAKPSSVSVHEFGQYSAVVTVEPLSMHSDRSGAALKPHT